MFAETQFNIIHYSGMLMQKELLAELVIVQKNAYWEQCTIMHNNEQCKEWCCTIGVVLLGCTVYSTRCKKLYCWHKVLLHSWRHLNSHYM